ncbi:MAG: hypothetical protein H7Y37_17390 [Anaerolineae bacterium]|nr:hypothetical protein [Gloeobacterales cyanobacterium ES-bin-313]
MKLKHLAGLVVLCVGAFSLPALASPEPLLWNYTKQTVVFTVCNPDKNRRPSDYCEVETFASGEYAKLNCDAPVCTVSVQATGKIAYQKVRYQYGMGVTLDRRGLRAFVYK